MRDVNRRIEARCDTQYSEMKKSERRFHKTLKSDVRQNLMRHVREDLEVDRCLNAKKQKEVKVAIHCTETI